jgi:hypothetical protein
MIDATTSAALATIESLVNQRSAGSQSADRNKAASATAEAGDPPANSQATDSVAATQDTVSFSAAALRIVDGSTGGGQSMSLNLSLMSATQTGGTTGKTQTEQISLGLAIFDATSSTTDTGGAVPQFAISVDGVSGPEKFSIPAQAAPDSASDTNAPTAMQNALAAALADATAGPFSISISSDMVGSGSSYSNASEDKLTISVDAQGKLTETASHSSEQTRNGVVTTQLDTSTLSLSNDHGNAAVTASSEVQTSIATEAADGGLASIASEDEKVSEQITGSTGSMSASSDRFSAAESTLTSLIAFEKTQRTVAPVQPWALGNNASAVHTMA